MPKRFPRSITRKFAAPHSIRAPLGILASIKDAEDRHLARLDEIGDGHATAECESAGTWSQIVTAAAAIGKAGQTIAPFDDCVGKALRDFRRAFCGDVEVDRRELVIRRGEKVIRYRLTRPLALRFAHAARPIAVEPARSSDPLKDLPSSHQRRPQPPSAATSPAPDRDPEAP